MPEQALSGIRVIDVTQHIAGPHCTKMLADFGAEVIKIEKPGEGDPARRAGPFPGDEPHPEKSGLFLYLNTNKKGISLDLKSRAGVKVFKELVKSADIVVENFEPRVMQSLGLDYAVLSELNPRLVMTSISNFGQTGPYRDYKATNFTMLAIGGALYVTGDPERGPLKTGGSQAEYMAGLIGLQSTLLALYARGNSEIGQHVDVSIMDCLAGNLEGTTSEYAYMGTIRRGGKFSRIIYGHPVGNYPCKDGHVVVIPGLGGVASVALLVEQPELEEHHLFVDRYARMQNPEEFDALILPWLQAHDKQEIEERAQELRMPFAALLNPGELLEDPQLEAREFFASVEHPVAGSFIYPGASFKLSETPWQAGRAPLLGEHNEEIYQGILGYGRDDLVRLREMKVI